MEELERISGGLMPRACGVQLEWKVLHLDCPGKFPNPFAGRAHSVVVWASEAPPGAEVRCQLAAELIRGGSSNLHFGGTSPELWHDDADQVVAELGVAADSDADWTGVTTWHDGEAFTCVLDFARDFAATMRPPPEGILVVTIGLDPAGRAELGAAMCQTLAAK